MRHLAILAVLLDTGDRWNNHDSTEEHAMSGSHSSIITPVTVSAVVAAPRADVYACLEKLENHAEFTTHMFSDWSFEGPGSGLGARARMRFSAAGRRDRFTVEIVGAMPPQQLVERSVSANGKRVTVGTYTLEDLEPDRTRVTFELTWTAAPLMERLLAPITRAVVRRQNGRAMAALARQA